MIDYMLRFADEAEMRAVLAPLMVQKTSPVISFETGEWSEEPVGDPYLPPATEAFAVDVIGVMSVPSGQEVIAPDGGPAVVLEDRAGWHVNLRLARAHPIEAAITDYVVTPETPDRVWS